MTVFIVSIPHSSSTPTKRVQRLKSCRSWCAGGMGRGFFSYPSRSYILIIKLAELNLSSDFFYRILGGAIETGCGFCLSVWRGRPKPNSWTIFNLPLICLPPIWCVITKLTRPGGSISCSSRVFSSCFNRFKYTGIVFSLQSYLLRCHKLLVISWQVTQKEK